MVVRSCLKSFMDGVILLEVKGASTKLMIEPELIAMEPAET